MKSAHDEIARSDPVEGTGKPAGRDALGGSVAVGDGQGVPLQGPGGVALPASWLDELPLRVRNPGGTAAATTLKELVAADAAKPRRGPRDPSAKTPAVAALAAAVAAAAVPVAAAAAPVAAAAPPAYYAPPPGLYAPAYDAPPLDLYAPVDDLEARYEALRRGTTTPFPPQTFAGGL